MAAQDAYYWQNSLEFAEAEKTHHQNLAKSRRGAKAKPEEPEKKEAEAEKPKAPTEAEKAKAQTETKKSKAKGAKKNKAAAVAIAVQQTIRETAPDAPVRAARDSAEKGGGQCSLADEVAKAREHIKKSLECMDIVLANAPTVADKTASKLESDLEQLKLAFADLKGVVVGLQAEIKELKNFGIVPRIAICPMKPEPTSCPRPMVCPAKPPAQPAPKPSNDDDDDGVDLFGSDSEDDAEAAKIRDERLAAYAAKKSKKPALIAKSNIILDCKPWDDETDMKAMEDKVRTVVSDGLLWGASKLVPLAYGIRKLQISCVIEDDKVSVDWLQEEIEKFEDFVQSVDIAAFNKV